MAEGDSSGDGGRRSQGRESGSGSGGSRSRGGGGRGQRAGVARSGNARSRGGATETDKDLNVVARTSTEQGRGGIRGTPRGSGAGRGNRAGHHRGRGGGAERDAGPHDDLPMTSSSYNDNARAAAGRRGQRNDARGDGRRGGGDGRVHHRGGGGSSRGDRSGRGGRNIDASGRGRRDQTTGRPVETLQNAAAITGQPSTTTPKTRHEAAGNMKGGDNKTKTSADADADKRLRQHNGTQGKPVDQKKHEAAKGRGKGGPSKAGATVVSDGGQKTNAALILSIPPSQPQQTSDINYGKGAAITILHVAEKPSIAQAIAKGLTPSASAIQYRSKSLPVHDFTTPGGFDKAPHATKVHHKVTSVAGHVFAVDFPNQFQSWDAVDPAELFDAPIQRKAQKGSIVRHLQDEAKHVDFIVLWMDCDREGENINFEVLDCCLDRMKSTASGDDNYNRVYRAHFSAINPSDIVKAYKSLGKPDRNQSLSVDARQELDLKVGVAFSRFQTRFFQGRYGDLDSSVLSYGPCQTPTLGFCVQRHIDIETFKPEPYWVLELNVMKRGRNLRALWGAGRSFNKNKVDMLQQKAFDDGPAVRVANVVTKDKKQGRPVPLNTVALLKACSKALGIGPHAAMQTAERLYLSGYLSYPRTESTAYPTSFDIRGTLQQQATDGRWGAYVRDLLQGGGGGPNKSRSGVDMGDHPPITPARAARAGELSGDMYRVYELVVRHFIASVSPDAVWRSTRVDFVVDALAEKGIFTLRGKEPVSPGFLAVLLHKEYGDDERDPDADPDDEDEEERAIPEFRVGESIPIINPTRSSNSTKVAVSTGEMVRASLDIKEKKTTPPGYLTESELIGMMEKNGIGTDASIPTHIENIQKRNYVSLQSGRRLIPEKLGIVLVQGYHQIDSSLVLPRVRSDIEDQCNKIAKGLATKEAVVRRAIDLFREKFIVFVKSIDKMDVLFSSSFSKLEDIGKPFTRCGFTRRYLQYITGPPPRLYNKWTESVYPLPIGGVVKQWTGRLCPVEGCNFELCMYSAGQPERTFPLCPRCFNDPKWALDTEDLPEDEDDRADVEKERHLKKVAGRSMTLHCPLPDDHPLIADMTVANDEGSDGVLILDPHFGPKWRLVSTRAPTIVHLPKNVDKVTILDKINDEYEVHLMTVEFKPSDSPLPNGEVKYTTCFPIDRILQDQSRVFHGSERLKASGRGGRGRGRGRGRGGRGRGGGGRGRR